jgi:exonuclease SbcC
MRIRRLYLKAFGPFTDKILNLASAEPGLVVVHGINEAGKSCALRAISDLLFGIPQQSKDNFVHVHADMRIGGEFEDQNGTAYSFMRRKGRNSTLYYTNCGPDIPSTDKPVPPEIEALLTYGLTKEAYDSMFGLDHRRLREGGQALLKGPPCQYQMRHLPWAI